MKLFKYAAMLCICCSCQAQGTAQAQGGINAHVSVYKYDLVTPESKGWNTPMSPDLPSVEKRAALCPAILQSFRNTADTESDICNRIFDSKLGFENIDWRAMSNSEVSRSIIEEIAQSQIPVTWDQEQKQEKFERLVNHYLSILNSNSDVFSQSSFDLDNDGQIDLVYRLKTRECNASKIDGGPHNAPIEPFYVSIDNDGRIKYVLGLGHVMSDGTLFRYKGRTYASRSSTFYLEGKGRHIAIHPIFPKTSKSGRNVARPVCIIEESR